MLRPTSGRGFSRAGGAEPRPALDIRTREGRGEGERDGTAPALDIPIGGTGSAVRARSLPATVGPAPTPRWISSGRRDRLGLGTLTGFFASSAPASPQAMRYNMHSCG